MFLCFTNNNIITNDLVKSNNIIYRDEISNNKLI